MLPSTGLQALPQIQFWLDIWSEGSVYTQGSLLALTRWGLCLAGEEAVYLFIIFVSQSCCCPLVLLCVSKESSRGSPPAKHRLLQAPFLCMREWELLSHFCVCMQFYKAKKTGPTVNPNWNPITIQTWTVKEISHLSHWRRMVRKSEDNSSLLSRHFPSSFVLELRMVLQTISSSSNSLQTRFSPCWLTRNYDTFPFS